MAKVMRKEASEYAKVGSSLRKCPVLEHLPPKPESAYFTLYALTYTSEFMGGCPPPFSEKELTCSSS